MLDYDEIREDLLVKKLVDLQHEFKLGNAEVFTSSIKTIYFFGFSRKFPFLHVIKKPIKKRHVYFFQDPMVYWRALRIIHKSECDEAFRRWRMIRHNIVLRISPKSDGHVPKPDFVVKSPFAKPEIKWFKRNVYEMLKGEKYGS